MLIFPLPVCLAADPSESAELESNDKMWKRSKVTDQTAAGQAGKCRVMDVLHGYVSLGFVLQLSPPGFPLNTRNDDEQDHVKNETLRSRKKPARQENTWEIHRSKVGVFKMFWKM